MKTLFRNLIIAVSFLVSGSALGQSSIEVTIRNIRAEKGNIMVGLFNNEDDFLKKALHGKVVKASGNSVTVVFENLPSGDYAVSIVHDENENGEMDTNLVGLPKEGFAFGNNAMGMFGPPSFDKAKVQLDGKPQKQDITMKYM